MGAQCSPASDPTFQKAWGDMPSDGEIVITRDRIVVTRKRALPPLEIASRLVDLDRKGSIPDEKDQGMHSSGGLGNASRGSDPALVQVDSGGRTSNASVQSVIRFPKSVSEVSLENSGTVRRFGKSDSVVSLENGDTVRRVGTDRSDDSVFTTNGLGTLGTLAGSPTLQSLAKAPIPEEETAPEIVISNEAPPVQVEIATLERDENAHNPFPRMRRQNDSMLSLPGAPTLDDGEESDAEWAAHERNPTTIFDTLSTPLPSPKRDDLENLDQQWEAQDREAVELSKKALDDLAEEAKANESPKEDPKEEGLKKPNALSTIKIPTGGIGGDEVRKKKKLVRDGSMPIENEFGKAMLKKLATKHEQKGKMEMQVFFTRKKKGNEWPHLVVTVGEDWPWIKVIRKSLATIQKNLKKGDRNGTHDWVFGYHPNKDIRRMRKELKVLLGNRGLEFRDGLLKKHVKEATKEFVNKIWVIQKTPKSNPASRREKGNKARGKSSQVHRRGMSVKSANKNPPSRRAKSAGNV